MISSEQYIEALSTNCVNANSIKMFKNIIYQYIVKYV